MVNVGRGVGEVVENKELGSRGSHEKWGSGESEGVGEAWKGEAQ